MLTIYDYMKSYLPWKVQNKVSLFLIQYTETRTKGKTVKVFENVGTFLCGVPIHF